MKFWIRVSPRGCVKTALPGEMARSAKEAHEVFTQDRVVSERERDFGWRVELVDDAAWDKQVRPCLLGTCAHRGGKRLEKRNPMQTTSRRHCRVCGHSLDSHDEREPCGRRWDVCNDPDCAEPRMERWLRREQLQILLSRMERGVLLPEERKLLRATVLAEVSDVERAYALVAKMKANR